ncbi:hypothetical protein [Ruminococcus sp.]|uniref:hypothetical protein n=1 Tax=Ruminococcus sp. TaxID=41978 RepID=UPI0025DFCE79|nr:hypothetical protein [Ruminococcus sp.]MBR1432479.1 hypothetical protein [Ruminococcus sp.]
MDFETKINNIEKGKQIGCRIMRDNIFIECGIQKKGQLYLVYIASHDLDYDYMDSGKKEYYSFSEITNAIHFIISRDFNFNDFATQKGNKIFNIGWFRKDNTVIK